MLPTGTNLQEIEKSLKSIDMTPIVAFRNKIDQIASMNKMMAPVYLRDFIVAQDLASQGMSMAIRCMGEAKSALDTAESIAYLDRAADYLKARNIKDTSEARKQYVSVDADVIAAKSMMAKSEAMLSLLKNLLYTFKSAEQATKKIAYDEPGTPYVGMD